MTSYEELIRNIEKENLGRFECLKTFERIIKAVNSIAETYKDEPGIDNINPAYPSHSTDYLFISIYLSEKGSIKKDIGTFIEALQEQTNLKLVGEPSVDAKYQKKTWQLTDETLSWEFKGTLRHPRVTIQANAEKSRQCIQVDTGKTEPIYEFICEDE